MAITEWPDMPAAAQTPVLQGVSEGFDHQSGRSFPRVRGVTFRMGLHTIALPADEVLVLSSLPLNHRTEVVRYVDYPSECKTHPMLRTCFDFIGSRVDMSEGLGPAQTLSRASEKVSERLSLEKTAASHMYVRTITTNNFLRRPDGSRVGGAYSYARHVVRVMNWNTPRDHRSASVQLDQMENPKLLSIKRVSVWQRGVDLVGMQCVFSDDSKSNVIGTEAGIVRSLDIDLSAGERLCGAELQWGAPLDYLTLSTNRGQKLRLGAGSGQVRLSVRGSEILSFRTRTDGWRGRRVLYAVDVGIKG
jgi:hypothetical protein